MSQIIRSVTDLYLNQIDNRGIRLHLDINLPYSYEILYTDEKRLSQILVRIFYHIIIYFLKCLERIVYKISNFFI